MWTLAVIIFVVVVAVALFLYFEHQNWEITETYTLEFTRPTPYTITIYKHKTSGKEKLLCQGEQFGNILIDKKNHDQYKAWITKDKLWVAKNKARNP